MDAIPGNSITATAWHCEKAQRWLLLASGFVKASRISVAPISRYINRNLPIRAHRCWICIGWIIIVAADARTRTITVDGIYVILHVERLSIDMSKRRLPIWQFFTAGEWSPGDLQRLQRECIERFTVGKIIHDNKPCRSPTKTSAWVQVRRRKKRLR